LKIHVCVFLDLKSKPIVDDSVTFHFKAKQYLLNVYLGWKEVIKSTTYNVSISTYHLHSSFFPIETNVYWLRKQIINRL